MTAQAPGQLMKLTRISAASLLPHETRLPAACCLVTATLPGCCLLTAAFPGCCLQLAVTQLAMHSFESVELQALPAMISFLFKQSTAANVAQVSRWRGCCYGGVLAHD